MHINELEPLLEPWECAAFAVNRDTSEPAARLASARVSSQRVLHLNATQALRTAVNELRFAYMSESHEGGAGGGLEAEGGRGAAIAVVDLASGDSGGCAKELQAEHGRLTVSLVKQEGGRDVASAKRGGAAASQGARNGQERGGGRSSSAVSHRHLRQRWTPALSIATSEARESAHRVWAVDAQIRPHAVVISEVRVALRAALHYTRSHSHRPPYGPHSTHGL